MNHIMFIILGALLLAALAPFIIRRARKSEFLANAISAINITPKGRGTRLADANFTSRYLLAKQGSDASHIGVCGVSDQPFAVVPDSTPTADQAASDLSYPLPVNILGLNEDTERMVASAAISIDDLLVPAASGKVRKIPTDTAGAYWVVGKAVTAASADGDLVEVAPCTPYIRTVGLATGGVMGFAAGYGNGGSVTQASSASTGVTVNANCGQITTVALTTAAGAEERFTVTNSAVSAKDVIVLSSTYNGNGTPAFSVTNVTAGAFDVIITNLHASAAFNAAMVLNFAVINVETT